MADKDRKSDKMLPPRVPRPNYQIWIILGLVAVILGVSYFRTGELTELQSSKFEDMVQSRDIKKLVLIENEKEVEIT
jgi:AFG3 family protein